MRCCACGQRIIGAEPYLAAAASCVGHAFGHELQEHDRRSTGSIQQLAQQPLIHLGLHLIKPVDGYERTCMSGCARTSQPHGKR
jgi:hypothetical protein